MFDLSWRDANRWRGATEDEPVLAPPLQVRLIALAEAM